MTNMIIGTNVVVSLAYQLHLGDEQVIDAADSNEPLVYLHGAGNIVAGLERELAGLTIGDEKNVAVEPADGYGEIDDDEFQAVPRSIFPPNLALEEGMGLRLVDQNTGQPVEAYVAEIEDDHVLLDFNHPLAGETLHFAVRIVDLRPATQEELAHGHPHTAHTH
jgi:FKBP-type peptidyl-prolyl cis-trans isomerase SlyD